MAIGKISGPMLQTNLERQGVDLSIDSTTVYVDVTNKRLGVNTQPGVTLDVNGNANIANLRFNGNTISSTTGKVNLGDISNVQINGGVANYVIYTDGAGNLTFGNLDVLSGLEGFTANYITLGSNAVGSFGNAVTLTTANTVTDAIALINQNVGNVTANVTTLLSKAYSNANAASYFTTYSGNIGAGNVISGAFYGNVNTNYITANTGNIVTVNGTGAIKLPVGTNSNRPTGDTGQIRFNSDLSVVEFFNGTNWIAITNNITDQQITPDGVLQTFTLSQSATAAGVIVSINGTLQAPGVAYTVSGTTITFAEIPQATDYIDVRFIATAVTPNLDYETIDTANVAVGTANTIIDTFNSSQFRSAKYAISSTNPYDSQYSEVNLIQKGATVAIITTGTVNTGANTISFSANINGSNVNLLALGTTAANQLRIKRTYFNA